MAEGADVTVRYEFLPTERSIRESAERVVKKFSEVSGRQKWGTGIYSKDYFSKMNEAMKKSYTRQRTEFNKTTDSIINFLRATQQKTSLQTKILSGIKFLEGKGITGGVGGVGERGITGEPGVEGGEGGEIAGKVAGGGMMAALGTIAALLVVISIAMMLISAFFDAVGPIIKVVVKMISAMILILLMPFLKRGLPVLFGILKWMIQMSKGISKFVDMFMTYIEKLLGRAMGGDPMAILELFVGPLGMLIIYLGKKLVEFLAKIDWGAVINAVVSKLESAFEIIKSMINTIGTSVFGVETWGKIKEGIRIIHGVFSPGGIWESIKGVIDYIGKEVFGEGIWTTIKTALGEATDGVIAKFIALRDKLGEILTGLINLYNNTIGLITGNVIRVPLTPVSGWSRKITYTGPKAMGGTRGGETIAERDARVAGYIAGGVAGDFISRPGGGIQPFSPADTIIGTKTPGTLGGVNITNHLNVSAGVDKNEFRKILSEFSRQQARELRTRTSYYGG